MSEPAFQRTATAAPSRRAAPSVGSALLSRMDLSDGEVIKDAAHQFRRCDSEAALAGWARKWGGAFVAKLLAGPDRDDVEDTEEYREVSGSLDELTTAANAAVHALEKLAERDDLADDVGGTIENIAGELEQAVREAA